MGNITARRKDQPRVSLTYRSLVATIALILFSLGGKMALQFWKRTVFVLWTVLLVVLVLVGLGRPLAAAVPTPANVDLSASSTGGREAAAGITSTTYLPLITSLPLNLLPVNLTCNSNNWAVNWSAGSTGAVYELQEDDNAGFTSPVIYTTTEPFLDFTHAPSVDNYYNYRVRQMGGTFWSNTVAVVGGFFDNFSTNTSGWIVVDNDHVQMEYALGKYYIRPKQASSTEVFLNPSFAPDFSRNNYRIEVDARWQTGSPTDGLYGVVFGSLNDASKFYFIAIYPSLQQYRVFFFDSTLPVNQRLRIIVGATFNSAINSGTGLNHIVLTRVGADIRAEVNGTVLGIWSDGEITGTTYYGLMATSHPNNPVAHAEFDNFAVGYCHSINALTGGESSVSAPLALPDYVNGAAAAASLWDEYQ